MTTSAQSLWGTRSSGIVLLWGVLLLVSGCQTASASLDTTPWTAGPLKMGHPVVEEAHLRWSLLDPSASRHFIPQFPLWRV